MTLSVNGATPSKVVSVASPSCYIDSKNIECPDVRTYLKTTVRAKISSLPAGN